MNILKSRYQAVPEHDLLNFCNLPVRTPARVEAWLSPADFYLHKPNIYDQSVFFRSADESGLHDSCLLNSEFEGKQNKPYNQFERTKEDN
jgi:hypothetical protein